MEKPLTLPNSPLQKYHFVWRAPHASLVTLWITQSCRGQATPEKRRNCNAEKTFVKGMDPIVSKHILDHSFNRSRDKERLRRRGEVFRLVFAESGVRKPGSRVVRFQLLCVFEKWQRQSDSILKKVGFQFSWETSECGRAVILATFPALIIRKMQDSVTCSDGQLWHSKSSTGFPDKLQNTVGKRHSK